MKRKTEVLYLRLPIDLKNWLDNMAYRAGVSMNAYMIMILRAMKEDVENESKKMKEGNNEH
jgi:predicted HicB family RNase H-like nuclease